VIEFTPEQRRAAEQGEPVRVVDPETHDTYVLLRAEVFERLACDPHQPGPRPEIPPALIRSQQAFWRDLPELLRTRRNHGKWVAYCGDERVGVAADDADLIRACQRRGLRAKDYYLDVIEPMSQPPWLHEEEVAFGLAEHDEEPAFPDA
jgi:hypothetical protein